MEKQELNGLNLKLPKSHLPCNLLTSQYIFLNSQVDMDNIDSKRWD